MSVGRGILRVAAGLAGLLLTGGAVSAHNLLCECTLKDGRVRVEAFYDTNEPAGNARVQVRDGRQQAVAEGRTDEKGVWSFPAPAPGRYDVVVDAGGGHRATDTITVPAAPPEEIETEEVWSRPIGQGPPRAEATRTPWLEIGVGVLGAGVFALLLWLRNRMRATRRRADLALRELREPYPLRGNDE
jgi:hypothetical protein